MLVDASEPHKESNLKPSWMLMCREACWFTEGHCLHRALRGSALHLLSTQDFTSPSLSLSAFFTQASPYPVPLSQHIILFVHFPFFKRRRDYRGAGVTQESSLLFPPLFHPVFMHFRAFCVHQSSVRFTPQSGPLPGIYFPTCP